MLLPEVGRLQQKSVGGLSALDKMAATVMLKGLHCQMAEALARQPPVQERDSRTRQGIDVCRGL
jgi:hypothetical protein